MVGVRTQDNAKDFKQPVVIAYYAVDYKKNPKGTHWIVSNFFLECFDVCFIVCYKSLGTNYWRNRILKVAEDFKDDFSFAISNKDEFQYEMNEYGIDFTPSDKPIVTAKNAKGQKFIQQGEFS